MINDYIPYLVLCGLIILFIPFMIKDYKKIDEIIKNKNKIKKKT